MIAKNAYNFGFAGEQVEVVVLKEPSEWIAIGISGQCHTTGKMIGPDNQGIVHHLDIKQGESHNA